MERSSGAELKLSLRLCWLVGMAYNSIISTSTGNTVEWHFLKFVLRITHHPTIAEIL